MIGECYLGLKKPILSYKYLDDVFKHQHKYGVEVIKFKDFDVLNFFIYIQFFIR